MTEEIGESLRQSISNLRRDLVQARQPEQDSLIANFLREQRAHLTPVEQALDRNVQEIARRPFLSSLHFPKIEDREDAIGIAHKDTLQWVLQHSSHRDVSWDNVAEWLSEREPPRNIYWVTGKPGSGKSTLMKFLADSATTSELLSRWASPDYIYTMKCFFWSPGTSLQKSMEGLLRTLLFQIFSDSKTDYTVIQSASPWRWYALVSGSYAQEAWSTRELSKVFASAVHQVAQHSKLSFFVDGLDEYGQDIDEQKELVELFLSFQENRNIKMCLSSRPWNIFKDSFEGFPFLRLEDLTHDDIVKFVEAECAVSKAFQDRPGSEQSLLKGEIVKKSDGVFLWVRLVVRRLLFEIQDGHRSPVTLLDEIPKGLDEYFEYMLQKISPEKQAQASRILQIMIGTRFGSDNPSLMTLSFTDEKIADFATSERVIQESQDAIEVRITSLKRLFQSQCMDLLVYRTDIRAAKHQSLAGLPWEDITVDYIHRSVKEFLCARTAQDLLQRYTKCLISVPRYMTNSLLTQILFMDKFPTASTSEERERKFLKLQFFHEFVENMKLIDDAANLPLKSYYDRAVAIALPILRDEQMDFSRSQGDVSFDANVILEFFKQQQSHAVDDPLLLALLYRFDAYVKARSVADLDEASVKTCFASVLFRGLSEDRIPMLLFIVKRWKKIEKPRTIYELLDTFHASYVDSGIGEKEDVSGQCAGVTLALINCTSGMKNSPAALKALAARIEESIVKTYHATVRDELVARLRSVQTSWIGVMPQDMSVETGKGASCCVVC